MKGAQKSNSWTLLVIINFLCIEFLFNVFSFGIFPRNFCFPCFRICLSSLCVDSFRLFDGISTCTIFSLRRLKRREMVTHGLHLPQLSTEAYVGRHQWPWQSADIEQLSLGPAHAEASAVQFPVKLKMLRCHLSTKMLSTIVFEIKKFKKPRIYVCSLSCRGGGSLEVVWKEMSP